MGCLASEEGDPEGLPPALCSCTSSVAREGGKEESLGDEVTDVIEEDVNSGLVTVGAGVAGAALEPRRERDPLPPTAEEDEDVDDIQRRNAIVSASRRRTVSYKLI